ncbi:PTS sugar transporter subunit IIC [Streptococcus macacae]|uniref:Membrane protein n=1 Tax=Streptococcus macacae NCTC 11558 TaxID=764298 RepID=G5JV60_9STRE|nr:PTS sugar transporter subunit IIC [Streptococcus macacae]EHJ51910.1 putative membrane protein [Streptococcus macacae NCTC 11558]SUN77685.1 PTS cellobiose-specific IIC component [Streptococcus macacae NCTC 11558]
MELFKTIRSILYTSMHWVFPLSLIYTVVVIIQNLFLLPSSFFSVTAGLKLFKISWMPFLIEHSMRFNRIVICLIACLFTARFIQLLLKRHQIDSFVPSIIVFLVTWLLFGQINFEADMRTPSQPIWLFLILGILLFYGFILLNQKFGSHLVTFRWLLISVSLYLALYWGATAYKLPLLNVNFYFQEGFSNLLGSGPSHLAEVILLSFFAVIFFSVGLIVPDILNAPTFSLDVVSDNLDSILEHSTQKIPHLFTLYTLQDAFALFGGVGLLLALAIAIIIGSKLVQQKTYSKMVYWSFIPLLFDQPLPLLLGFPILFQPLLLIPMLLTTFAAELLGAFVLMTGMLNPSVYEVPTGTPNILFGFLASNGDWRYLVMVALILSISVIIYLPFVKIVLLREAHDE